MKIKLPDTISQLLCKLESAGFQAFAVGGCVRDSLLGLPPKDWDLCTSALPKEMKKALSGYAVIPTGIAHGTMTVLTPEGPVEVTTFRRDGDYLDSRRPEAVTFLPDVAEDLARRDFTVNAMAYSEKTGLIDRFGGQADLAARLLRCVGNPARRLEEDALRILRGLRFAVCYGLTPEPETARALHQERERLSRIAAERVWMELSRMLAAPAPEAILQEYGDVLAAAVLPEALRPRKPVDFGGFLDRLPPVPALRLAGILGTFCPDASLETYTELFVRLRTERVTRIRGLRALQSQTLPLPGSLVEARRQAGEMGKERFSDWIAWRAARALPAEAAACGAARDFAARIEREGLCCCVEELAVTGKELVAHGMKPGRRVGKTLRRVLELVITEALPNEKNSLLAYIFSERYCNLKRDSV